MAVPNIAQNMRTFYSVLLTDSYLISWEVYEWVQLLMWKGENAASIF
jgi:hypothetical protein